MTTPVSSSFGDASLGAELAGLQMMAYEFVEVPSSEEQVGVENQYCSLEVVVVTVPVGRWLREAAEVERPGKGRVILQVEEQHLGPHLSREREG
mmetsp:Transcript_7134/g.13646  ORF Transcript_7134/g.13646 Transcript_7134/m.13646 type:complete len:94 (+) Transcript_7134:2842-3123(+)